nr:hypothetical protein HK105_007664 [Polyrhizophydium stewartii]
MRPLHDEIVKMFHKNFATEIAKLGLAPTTRAMPPNVAELQRSGSISSSNARGRSPTLAGYLPRHGSSGSGVVAPSVVASLAAATVSGRRSFALLTADTGDYSGWGGGSGTSSSASIGSTGSGGSVPRGLRRLGSVAQGTPPAAPPQAGGQIAQPRRPSHGRHHSLGSIDKPSPLGISTNVAAAAGPRTPPCPSPGSGGDVFAFAGGISGGAAASAAAGAAPAGGGHQRRGSRDGRKPSWTFGSAFNLDVASRRSPVGS